MNRNFNSVVTQKNIDQLTRSLDRVHLYDSKGNQKKLLTIKSQDFFRALDGLTLENLYSKM